MRMKASWNGRQVGVSTAASSFPRIVPNRRRAAFAITRLASRKASSTFSSASASIPASILLAAILPRCNKASATSRRLGDREGRTLPCFSIHSRYRVANAPSAFLAAAASTSSSQRLHAELDVRDRSRCDRAPPRPRGSSSSGRVDSHPDRQLPHGSRCRAPRRTRKHHDIAGRRCAGLDRQLEASASFSGCPRTSGRATRGSGD